MLTYIALINYVSIFTKKGHNIMRHSHYHAPPIFYAVKPTAILNFLNTNLTKVIYWIRIRYTWRRFITTVIVAGISLAWVFYTCGVSNI